jgi:predicted ATPase
MSASVYFDRVSVPRLPALGGGNWEMGNLLPITVLFGKNGSGKSLLLRGWRDLQVAASHYVVPERTGELSFEPGFMQQEIDPDQRRSLSTRNFLDRYRQRIISRIQAYFVARGSTREKQLPGNLADLEQLLTMLLPDFTLELIGGNPPYVLTRSDSQRQVQNVDELSTGEAQLLTLGLDVLIIAAIWEIQNATTRLLLIDEPDAHIHPDLQVRFADFLNQVADKYSLQIVIATHSTTMLSAIGQFAGDDCGIVYFDRTRTAFVAEGFTGALKEIAACLGGHALMGPLFGAPVLLVEGDDDYRIWSQVPRHHVTSFSVIPSHGDEIFNYQRALEKIFAALRERPVAVAGFALLDGDKPLPQPTRDQPQNYVKFIRLSCHEAENLYLADEVMQQIGTTWPEACTAIAAAAGLHGNKAAVLSSVASWDRMSADVKNVVAEVSLAIDSKHVHWTQRVGVAIGCSKPTGQLARFLGSDVIAALWR